MGCKAGTSQHPRLNPHGETVGSRPEPLLGHILALAPLP